MKFNYCFICFTYILYLFIYARIYGIRAVYNAHKNLFGVSPTNWAGDWAYLLACSAGYDAPGCNAALPINIKEAYRQDGVTKGCGSAFKPEAASEFTFNSICNANKYVNSRQQAWRKNCTGSTLTKQATPFVKRCHNYGAKLACLLASESEVGANRVIMTKTTTGASKTTKATTLS